MASDHDITLFAKTNFRNRETPFGIRRDDRRRHMYIIGKTGMGKTTLIENMVVQDILNGHGVCFVDPHGDSVEKVLQYIPSNRINDVIYLNPADVDFPIAFNPMEAVDPKHKHLVASGLMGVFTKIWAGVWSSRMEYILNNTILALLDSPGNTMLGIVRMYVDKAYRKKIVDNIKDPVVKSFWVDEFANYQDKFRTEAIAPIQNKVGQFLSNAIIRNIVGQTKSSIDLRDIMDNKKILLLNLSKGRIGEDSSALLGAMIITKLQLAAMSRVDTPEEERADFYLYVDEFQNFATESFANILSEARKYRLNLIVAHQYIGQLVQDKNTIVRDAIFGNVGTMITFRVGADDAEFLEKEFEPVYTMNDLVNLSKFNIYLKLMINGVASNPFSAATLPPISQPTGNVDKVIKVSRERYATPRITVEQKIGKWLGAEFHNAAAQVESGSVDEEGAEENMRFRHAQRPATRPAPPSTPRQQVAPAKAPTPPPAPKPTQPVPPPVATVITDSNIIIANTPIPSKADLPIEAEVRPVQAVQGPPQTPAPAKPQHDRRGGHERRDQKRPEENRRQQPERRVQQVEPHPGRRSTDKKKPKHENPIWDTVNALTKEKVAERASKTDKALEILSKSFSQATTIQKHKPEQKAPQPAPPPAAPAIKAQVQKAVATEAPAKAKHKQPVEVPTFEKPKPKLRIDPDLPDAHVNDEDKFASPHHNIQDVITKHGQLKPGETIKFD